MLWSSMALKFLDEVSMKRHQSLGPQVIAIASNRLVSLWQNQSPFWWVKKLEKNWWCFLCNLPVTYTLSSSKFHFLCFNIKSSALDFVRLMITGHWGLFGWGSMGFFSCTDFILLWRWLLSYWRTGYKELRAVCHWNSEWQKVWIYDGRHILASLMFGRVHHAEEAIARVVSWLSPNSWDCKSHRSIFPSVPSF